MDAREQRGLEIAARMRINRGSTGWIVPSQSGNGKYLVKFVFYDEAKNISDLIGSIQKSQVRQKDSTKKRRKRG